MAHALAEADLRTALPTIGVPTLVLHGDADERSPLSVGQELHRLIPRSRLEVLPGLGHECFLEAPEAFSAAVRNFLEQVEAGSA
jgi:pimeloyl-ACP methyl ester carboxylesterase